MGDRFNAYRVLIAVEEEASFTRAAQRLSLPQPWISAQIRNWEEKAGFSLFLRPTSPSQPVEATPRGHQLVAQARRVLAEVEAFDELMGILHSDSQPLRIGADPITGEFEQRMSLFDRITNRYPELTLQVINMDDEVSLQAVREGNLDVCFVMGPAPSVKQFRSRLLCKLRMSLLIPKEHPLAKLERIPVAKLKGERLLISTRSTHPLSADLLKFWKSLGFAVQESIDSHLIATTRMAQRMHVITVSMLEDAPKEWGLTEMVQRPFDDIRPAIDFRVVSLRKTQRPNVEKFWSCLSGP